MYTQIFLLIELIVVMVLTNKIINNQRQTIQEITNNVLKFTKNTNEFIDVLEKHYNLVLKNTKAKEIRIQRILDNAKKTKENYIETLNKIEKELSGD